MLAVSPWRLYWPSRILRTGPSFKRSQSSGNISPKGFYRLSLPHIYKKAPQISLSKIRQETKAEDTPVTASSQQLSTKKRDEQEQLPRQPTKPWKNARQEPSWIAKLGGNVQHQDNSEGTISLLEELFPKELSKKALETKAPREIPYRPISITVVSEEGENEENKAWRKPGTREKGTAWRHEQSTVLALRNASKHLTEEDFKAVLPTGRHLEGWTTGREGMKVIRSRDRNSLIPNGDYFILFRSATDAKAYLSNARRLHALSQTYTPKIGSLGGPLPPPPMPLPDEIAKTVLSDDGIILPQQSTHDELASYALSPPSEALNLKPVSEPFSPFIRDLVQRSGYEQLVQGRRTDYEVILHFDGWQPTLQAIKRAVNDDGKIRHLHWDIEHRSNGIRELYLRENTGEDSRTTTFKDQGPPEDSHRVWKRWVVSFWKEEEARRFVSAWHRRDIVPLLKLREAGMLPANEEVIMNAELIW